MRIGIIDIGSNSFLLLAAGYGKKGKIKVLEERIEVPRIGEGIRENGRISRGALDRASRSLFRLKKICEGSRCEIVAIATEALRRASNRANVVSEIFKRTGLRIRILSGKQEAKLSWLSATLEMRGNDIKDSVMADVGAMSTEVVYSRSGKLVLHSLPIGALSLAEHYSLYPPLSNDKLSKVLALLTKSFKRKKPRFAVKRLVCVGGTATTIPSVLKELTRYKRKSLDRYITDRERLLDLIKMLSGMSIQKIALMKGMPFGRADIFLSGLSIIYSMLSALETERVIIRNRGLRYGVLFERCLKNYPGATLKVV